jgi:membrane glycosyltransferase
LERSSYDTVIDKFPLSLRRLAFSLGIALTVVGLLWLAVMALSPGGIGALHIVLLALFAVTLPWYVIGFWNAVIGFLIMRFAPDPVGTVTPAARRVCGNEPITTTTAILLCIRNEPPERAALHIETLMAGLAEAGAGGRFHAYVLSDSDVPDIAATEEKQFSALKAVWHGRVALTYRRRAQNTGYKAGNIRDFCERWGMAHDFGVILDADSFMTAGLLLKLVRIMQLEPQIGILQTLVIGMPSASPFGRIFQFGMRLAMRAYTIGSAWWQADCGPYWGHNAIVRMSPFMACCQLPVLDAGALVKGHVLSHDQIEAVLMRKAGYEVRILAEEGASFEQNPPTLLEFVRRDLRWCQGNMQYWHFLTVPGLAAVSRYQLALALLMFIGSPAWIGLLLAGAAAATIADGSFIRADLGFLLLGITLLLWFAPNLATLTDVLSRRQLRQQFGGGIRLLAGFCTNCVFALLLAPIMWASHSLFFARLLLGRRIEWKAQTRQDHCVSWETALRAFWPHTLIGLAPLLLLAFTAPAAMPFALILAAGPLLSIPLAVTTASPVLGRSMIGAGICQLPEESHPPTELIALKLPALELAQHATSAGSAPRSNSAGRSVASGLQTVCGIARSLHTYYGSRERRADMDRLHRMFIQPGDLVFDVGAHVGDRIASFRRLGAWVVAVEPQPALTRTLEFLYGQDSAVTIEPLAVAGRVGSLELNINLQNPTVSTASAAFMAAAAGAPGWESERWTRSIQVQVITLDALIARHGMPAFIKLDIEGLEAQALLGLSHPPRALSFEFTTIQPDVAAACIRRCATLGYKKFNAMLGERHAFVHRAWLSAEEIAVWVASLPLRANSGDIYAVLHYARSQ